ncbi:TRAP transporter permease [Acidaminobacter hydrogenoformans]|uniref:TRAP transporter, 4TM/12TM fusion protein n=1 Tax=Acidaminobacter hydrogenoformans DSM 2784 TaxID=1120920 RepID=A0A1G5RZP9_9FIRM|nr:TRAP transporter permease [Acidaminobacter hydrogenoformans]SCZ79493.1 TRAP transporter, 4TM/12TM fusion protein [Acidaminobacter hydrogenoformans DSM 2784]
MNKKSDDLEQQSDVSNLKEKSDAKRNLTGWVARICSVIAIAMSLYHLYSSGISMLSSIQHKAIHVAFAMVLTFFIYPAGKKNEHKVPWYDFIIIGIAIFTGSYLVINYLDIVAMAGKPSNMSLVLGGITILMILEATRRTMGWPLVIVAVVALLYAGYGHLIPGALGHREYTWARIIEHMFLTGEGIYGVAIYVTSTYVFIFILMGALLGETGGAQSFIDMAFSMTGKYRGGPAKAAVVGSGLMGTISGSSFANVAGTGTFTIPLMKSIGYKPEFAGGVEAAASSGGQIMPPIMGAAAFIMAEMTGTPYGKLIYHAMIPAVLYYISVFLMVDLRAAKLNLRGLTKAELPVIRDILRRGGLLLLAPLSIFVMLIIGYSPIKASFSAVVIVFIVSMLRKETRLSWKGWAIALEKGAYGSLGVIAACGVAGLIVGSVTLTGLGLKFADLIVTMSAGNLYLALFLTMIAAIIMGMGMPTTALYIILGSMVAPALIKLNVPVIAAHLFIFYYGCMASVTPPVALSSYLAAAIAKADATKTAINGLKLASAAFILPFIFAISPELLLIDTTPINAIFIFITALIGIFGMASALEGYIFVRINMSTRLVLAALSICLLLPGYWTDIFGMIGIASISIYEFRKARMRPVMDGE